MSNKFLGLDTINVLKKYIDEQILLNENSTRIVNLHAYKYVPDSDGKPETPIGGYYDPEGGNITYPTDWHSLKGLLSVYDDEEAIEDALSEGSIWMSVGISKGNSMFDDWSNPIKISGQNGVSVRFKYSFNRNATPDERTDYPSGVNTNDRIEYVWSKYGEDDWTGPTIWAMYSEDASDIYWRYLVTAEEDENGNPIVPNRPAVNSNWASNFPVVNISQENPYMWMSWQRTAAGKNIDDDNWSDPVLFGHYGKDGLDGNVPDYTLILYKLGEGFIMPEKPVLPETNTVEEFRNANESWLDLPIKPEAEEELPEVDTADEDPDIWWHCSVKIHYNEENDIEEVIEISDVHRYNAVDGNAKPGQFTKYLFYWSDTQELPEDIVDSDWVDTPSYDDNNKEGSLWMKVTDVKINAAGQLAPLKPWSDPIKITGPRGPISYDYRMETRYNIGNSERPRNLPTEAEWYKNVPSLTSQYPYVWAANYLVVYKMKYNNDGDIVTADNGKVIESYSYYRLSGINGEDGNRKNSLKYSANNETVYVTSFSENNLYISNSAEDVVYEMNLDQLSFINGYTGKFANIGTGNVTINAGIYKFVGSNTEASTITLAPQEQIEVVCYNNANNKELIVIGKSIA
jgi:hypothetical protein